MSSVKPLESCESFNYFLISLNKLNNSSLICSVTTLGNICKIKKTTIINLDKTNLDVHSNKDV